MCVCGSGSGSGSAPVTQANLFCLKVLLVYLYYYPPGHWVLADLIASISRTIKFILFKKKLALRV